MSAPSQEPSGPSSGAGGFFVPGSSEANAAVSSYGLLSPAASSATATSSVTSGSVLPSPRRRPLKAGGAKESSFINYVDTRIRAVQRRFGIRVVDGAPDSDMNQHNGRDVARDDDDEEDYNVEEPEEQDRKPAASSSRSNMTATKSDGKSKAVDENAPNATATQGKHRDPGYTSFVQAATDISRLISIVWVSGTPSLQVHYLLSLALLVTTYIPEFPAAPKAMFSVLRKLDYSFASLAQGRDLDTGEVLPGFWGSAGEDEPGRGIASISETSKVRIRSLVERTRVVVVDVMNHSEGFEPDDASLEQLERNQVEMTDDEAYDFDRDDDYDEPEIDDDWDMEIARVYVRTLVELGTALGGSTDDAMVITG